MGVAEKRRQLFSELKKYRSLAIGFSGGVDSSLLLAAAVEVLEDRAVAITLRSAIHSEREIEAALGQAAKIGVRHIVVDAREMQLPEFRKNRRDRCYICKKCVFSDILAIAARLGLEQAAHGANLDDLGDFRPGFKAAQEMGIAAPLLDAGLSKADIRAVSKAMGLETWNKPAMACLATRIPYGSPLTPEKLKMVERAEAVFYQLGLETCRVRHHGRVARIEVAPEAFEILTDPAIRGEVVRKLKALGFYHVALDLEGYVQGSMNR